LFNNEDIAIFLLKVTLSLAQGQREEIGYNLLHIICQDLSANLESENILLIRKLMASYRHFNMSKNSAIFHYNSGRKGAMEMILTFLDFFRRGLPTHKKSVS
jgi:hypothetical protein